MVKYKKLSAVSWTECKKGESDVKENVWFSKTSDEKYYLQLYKIFKSEIDAGKLSAGSKLPSVRQTAMKYKVNMNTVLQSYNLLEQMVL